MSSKPWDDLIPEEDLGSFRNRYLADRPLEAGRRPAVVVVDMTYQFVDSAYPTGWSPTGRPAVVAVRRLLEAARAGGAPVYFTKAHADPGHVETPAERGRWRRRPHDQAAIGTPPGDVIVEELGPLPGEVVLYKGAKPSAFYGTPLGSLLVYERVDTVLVAGMTTSGCVRATVVDAFSGNFHVVVPAECVADRSQISHKVNLFDMHMKYADVVDLDEALAYLAAAAASPTLVGDGGAVGRVEA